VLRHVILGLPLLLPPCGFHSRAFFTILSLSRLNIFPIHFHFRYLISFQIFFYLVLSRKSSFDITFGHHIPKINLKLIFT
jgi:hypothetical protein